MYGSINSETFLKIICLMEGNAWLGENNCILVSGFRMQRQKIFVLQDCNPQPDILTGYSRALDRKVCIERQQARPLLYGKTVDAYVVNGSENDGNYLILNDRNISQSHLLDEYLNSCDEIDRYDKKSLSFSLLTPKRKWVIDTPKFIISSSSQLCKCVYDEGMHWAFPLGMYAIPENNLPICLSRQITLAIYNSKLFSFYKIEYEKMHHKERNVHYAAIKSFPIPHYISNEYCLVVSTLVDILVFYKEKKCKSTSFNDGRKIHYLQELIDMCVYELYFVGHMQKNNLMVVHELMQAPFMHKELDVEDKVEETYLWLMKSENKVRQRIMLLDTRSPQLLGRIHNFYFK